MKKVFFLSFGLVVFLVSLAQASIQSAILNDIVEESPQVWGITDSESGAGLRFVPDRGGIKICKAENKIIVGFYLSDDDIAFYNETFSDGRRKPIGFEIEVVDYSGVFNSKNIIDYNESFSQEVRYDDNAMLDNKNIYSVCINDPTKLEANRWHTVEIVFSSHTNIDLGTFAVQLQLVGDIRKLSEDYSNIYNQYSVTAKAELLSWWTVLGGHEDIDGNNFFNIRKPNIRFWRDKFFGWPEGKDTGYDRVFWRMGQAGERADYKPYSCGFGSDPWEDTGSNNEPPPPENNDPPVVVDPNDPEPTDPDSDPDLHINSFDLRELGAGSWVKEIYKTLYWGQSLQVEGRMEVENRSSQEAHDVDSDYRIENKRDFDKNDTKIDEDSPFDIDPGEREEKSMSPVTIAVSPNGQTVTVSRGSTSKGFPIVNGFAKIYFFVDVEEDDGDHDISSESDKDEYGKIELTIRPPILANFSASVFSGTNPLTVSFTDHSTNNPTNWSWNFGDGQYATGSNPSHTYSSPGIFTVSLTASNSLGTDSVTKVSYITVTEVVAPPEPAIPAPVLFRIVLVE